MKRTSTLPFFQVDSGKMNAEFMGLSMEERGMYVSLMLLYWENDCRLYSRESLVKKLGLRSQKGKDLLDSVIAEFFPDGTHVLLDACKENAEKTSKRQSANAQKGHSQRRQEGNPAKSPSVLADDPLEF